MARTSTATKLRALLFVSAAAALLWNAGGASAQTVVSGDCSLSSPLNPISHFPNPNPTFTSPTTSVSGSSTCTIHATLFVPPALVGFFSNVGVIESLHRAGLAQITGIVTETSTEFTFGPATILIGINSSVLFFVAGGTENTNTHVHTSNFLSINLSGNAASAITGDLHTTFHTTLIDQGFQFIGVLLSRGSENGVINGGAPGALFSPTPLGFAPDVMGAYAFDFDGALAFATKAPRAPMTAALGNGWRAWIRGTAGLARFEGTDANFGFRYRSASGEGGVERVVGQWMVGAAFGFGAAKVDQDATRDFGHLDTIRAGAYASYRPGPWWITAAVAVGFSNIDATRLSLLPTPARADYDATTVSAGIEAVKRIATAHAVYEPLAGLVYTGLRVDSFTETGTTFLDLAGSRANIDALKGYVGGRMYKVWTAPNGVSWSPEFRARLLYDFLDDPRGYTARFVADPAATPIPVTGLSPDRFATMLGVAATVRLNGWRAFGSYDAEIRGGDVAHLVSAGVKGSW